MVLFEFVAHNESVGRAFYLAAHLANTLLLLAALPVHAALLGHGGAVTAIAVTPGVHLLASPLLEGRKVTWRDDYAAVAGLLPYCRPGLIACSLP